MDVWGPIEQTRKNLMNAAWMRLNKLVLLFDGGASGPRAIVSNSISGLRDLRLHRKLRGFCGWLACHELASTKRIIKTQAGGFQGLRRFGGGGQETQC